MTTKKTDTLKEILLVEDDLDLRTILTYAIEKEGHKVTAFEDGAVALKWLNHHTPSLIVLDVLLPGMNGFDLCGRIQEHQRDEIRSTPVIITTALQEEDDKRRAYRLGAAMVFRKPLSPSRLTKHITAAMAGERRPIDLASPA